MPRLVMHIDAVQYHLDFLVALECLDCRFHVPFHDLTVEEQRGIGIAIIVETSVQRSEADLGFGDRNKHPLTEEDEYAAIAERYGVRFDEEPEESEEEKS